MENRLSIFDIFNYLKCDAKSRTIVEGERVMNAGHVVTCGIVDGSNEEELTIFCLCLQSSALFSPPHEIKGVFAKSPLKIKSFTCSCVAGAAGQCKHISAVLLLLYRSDIDKLEKLSVTDVKCIWKVKKPSVREEYTAIPVQDFCHVDNSSVPKYFCTLSKEEQVRFEERLSLVRPESTIARHRRAQFVPTVLVDICIRPSANNSNESIFKEIFEKKLPVDFCIPEYVEEELIDFYTNNVKLTMDEAMDINKKTLSQNDTLWMEQRKLRITGGVCYSLFTYCNNKNPNWDKKLKSTYLSTFQGNRATNHGLQFESRAKEIYQQKLNVSVLKCGFLIHPAAPWLGFSPDGLFLQNDRLILLEVKCPFSGKVMKAEEIVPNLSYVQIENLEYSLKKKHTYYGQVQLGMFVTGARECDFVIFSSFDDSFVLLKVPYNETFVHNFVNKLHGLYFRHLLPFLKMH